MILVPQGRSSSNKRSICAAERPAARLLTKFVDQGPGFELFEFIAS
jgi:hypothetical protein